MKIQIQGSGRRIGIRLPTAVLYSEFLLTQALKRSDLFPKDQAKAAAQILAREFRRIKETHGNWSLVEVESASGETIKITL